MRALITGGAGFIGSHLAEALLQRGDSVVALDNLSTGSLDNIDHLLEHPKFEFVLGDVTDDRAVADAVARVDTVFHLAAALGVKLVVDAPVHTIETNVNGTETVLRHACRDRKPTLIASTSEVYGKGTALPFREDADLVLGPPNKVRWGYATSKLIDEFLALGYWKERQAPVVVVRFFNTVGPRQSSRYGMVLPNFVRAALAGEPLIVHGDGSQTRSFTWVGDVVTGVLGLIGEPRAYGEVFNVGNGAETSIRELACKVQAMTGSTSEIVYTTHEQVFGQNFEDMVRRVPDISKIRRMIGFEPSVNLDGIIRHVIDFWVEKTPAQTSSSRAPMPIDEGRTQMFQVA